LDRAPGYEPGGLEVRTLSGAMIVQHFPSGPYQTNAYIVACKHTQQAAIIDPSPGSFSSLSEYIAALQLQPQLILLTHSHWDHIYDVAACKNAFNVPVWVHSLDRRNLEVPGSDGLPFSGSIEGVIPDHLLEEGERFSLGDLQFIVIHTPGHTPGGICIYNDMLKVLFSGDTLFRGTMGSLSLPTSQPELMWKSLEKLSQLPPETVVYPGHASRTTIGRESWLSDAKNIFG
jgi:hydroxyacylglutathione hydrolase